MADSKYANINRSKNGDLYKITAGCPCDDCELRQGCETDCRRFMAWVSGPSWRAISKTKREVQ